MSIKTEKEDVEFFDQIGEKLRKACGVSTGIPIGVSDHVFFDIDARVLRFPGNVLTVEGSGEPIQFPTWAGDSLLLLGIRDPANEAEAAQLREHGEAMIAAQAKLRASALRMAKGKSNG